MDSPKARAVNPPSAASSITKMISFMPYRSKAPLDSARFSVNSQERSGEQSARRRGHSESLRESLTFEFPLQRFNDSPNHVATASLIRMRDQARGKVDLIPTFPLRIHLRRQKAEHFL